jgi:hypothetical protein
VVVVDPSLAIAKDCVEVSNLRVPGARASAAGERVAAVAARSQVGRLLACLGLVYVVWGGVVGINGGGQPHVSAAESVLLE